MEKYWDYFKRGWWAQLVMLIFQLVLVLIVIPVAFIFNENKLAYYSIATILFIFVLVPFSGWLFLKYSNKFE
ncbi:MAG: hypothetical protein R3188_04110, partial [Acidiferrobacterales bacterium]|nr:hypothetical protein [Acidiferrobacterales bacterium]